MDKITIYKNKGETFECQFRIDGASIEETSVRLCLEFSNNKNMFFYGTLKHDGNCSIDIPVLKELGSQQGKMVIEAIADAMYFRLYEAEVEIKNSVEVSVVKKPTVEAAKPKTNIKLEQITSLPKKVKKQPDPEPSENEGWEPAIVRQPYQPIVKEEGESRLSKFEKYLEKKRSDPPK